MSHPHPFVSVVVPVYNEEASILRCLESILNQTIGPQNLDLIIVIAECSDNTSSIVTQWVATHQSCFSRLIIAFNPKTILSSAWNIGVRNAVSEYVVLSSGHFFMKYDYVELLFNCISREPSLFTVGGNILLDSSQVPTGYFSSVLKSLYQTRSLVGNASYRIASRTREDYLDYDCDTACFGCYKKTEFLSLGGFDEDLKRSQDFEFHCRLRKLGLRQARSILAMGEYRLRIQPLSAFKYAYINGYWIARPLAMYPYIFKLRHVIPFLFTLSLLTLLLMVSFSPLALLLLGFAIFLYLAFVLSGLNDLPVKDYPAAVLISLVFHLLYGIGYGVGLASSLRVFACSRHE